MFNVDPSSIHLSFSPGLAQANFIYYTVMVTLILLNLLIALMGGSYDRVRDGHEAAYLAERAEMILGFEIQMDAAVQNDSSIFPP